MHRNKRYPCPTVATSPYGKEGVPSETYTRSALALDGCSFHPTNTIWHPSFDAPADGEGGLVAARVVPELNGVFRISFRGRDDTGYERNGFTLDEARAFMCRLPSIITMEWLWARGFVPA